MGPLLLLAAAVGLGVVGALVALSNLRSSRRALLEQRNHLMLLPVKDARERAEAALRSWTKTTGSKAMETAIWDALGPLTASFLAGIDEVASPNGAHRFGGKHLGQSQYRQDFIAIGKSDYLDICVKPGSDVVYVIDGTESEDAEPDDQYPSVFHLLVDYAELGAAAPGPGIESEPPERPQS